MCRLFHIIQYFKFNTRIRKSGESIATYVAELLAIREHCDFGDTLDLMITDRLVCVEDTLGLKCLSRCSFSSVYVFSFSVLGCTKLFNSWNVEGCKLLERLLF